MLASIAILPIVIAPLLGAPAPPQCRFERLGNPAADERAVTAFSERVERYADLHRRLDRSMGGLWLTSDPELIAMEVEHLGDALRDARPGARAGDIFTADVADVIRLRIGNNLRTLSYDPRPALFDDDDDDESWAGPVPLAVNDPFPWHAPNAIWPSVLAVLPPLPAELEYRFVGRTLVLLDVDANLVIDVLEQALPVH